MAFRLCDVRHKKHPIFDGRPKNGLMGVNSPRKSKKQFCFQNRLSARCLDCATLCVVARAYFRSQVFFEKANGLVDIIGMTTVLDGTRDYFEFQRLGVAQQ